MAARTRCASVVVCQRLDGGTSHATSNVMDPNAQQEFSLVYRGFDPTEAGMLARLLEAEGIICRHLGTHHPAFIGVGELGCEQRLEVPLESAGRARELIDAAHLPVDPERPTDPDV